MTNLQSHAKSELDILAKQTPDALVLEFTPQILALCEAFGKSGQSGGSAPFVSQAIANTFKKLAMFETLSPITGADHEWTDVSEIRDHEPLFQNNRDGRIFKNGKTGLAHFIEAIIFDGNMNGRFSGNGVAVPENGVVGSAQYIKSFPFTPKTFYVVVIDERFKDKEATMPDENGDWWTHKLKDPAQLKAVFEYYDKMD